MKKLLIGSLLVLATGTASAFEVGVTGSRNYDTDRNSLGVLVSKDFKRLNLTAGFDHSNKDSNKVDRWSVVGGLNLFKLGDATVAAKAGGLLLVEEIGSHGYAGTAGLGVKLPLDKKVSFTVDVMRQWGETSVKRFDGNSVTLGVRVKL